MSDRLFTHVYLTALTLDNENKNFASMSVSPSQQPGGKTLNPNTYATRKTIAQGMLDIALLTANASQLRYVLNLGDKHENYELMIGLIVTSLVLQLLVAVLSFSLSLFRDCCLDRPEYSASAIFLNQFNLYAVFVVTVLNIILTAFGVYPANYSISPPQF
ncbi:Ninjurin [Trinorchestia longiramus]|nr:Ninjurin [Trinorchestia longiramus]